MEKEMKENLKKEVAEKAFEKGLLYASLVDCFSRCAEDEKVVKQNATWINKAILTWINLYCDKEAFETFAVEKKDFIKGVSFLMCIGDALGAFENLDEIQ